MGGVSEAGPAAGTAVTHPPGQARDLPSPTQTQMQAIDDQWAAALDWMPQLPAEQELAAWGVAALGAALVYAATAPSRFSPAYAAGIALVFAALAWVARGVLMERLYQVFAFVVRKAGPMHHLLTPHCPSICPPLVGTQSSKCREDSSPLDPVADDPVSFMASLLDPW
jgi:hypothetical protein